MLKTRAKHINHGKIININIVYELDKTYVKTHPTLVNCLFGAVGITKNPDIDQNKYSGYGIGFDRTGVYLLPDGCFGRNVVIFGVDMSSSVHVDDKGKDILILGTGPTQVQHLHSAPHRSLQHAQQYLNQNIARNWAISPNLGQKTKSCPFLMKIGTYDILKVLIPNPNLDF